MRVFFSFCFVFKLLWRKEERGGRGGEREREKGRTEIGFWR